VTEPTPILKKEHLEIQAEIYAKEGPELPSQNPGASKWTQHRKEQAQVAFNRDYKGSNPIKRLIMVRTGVDGDGDIYFLIQAVNAPDDLRETLGCIQSRCYYRGRLLMEVLIMIENLHNTEGTEIFMVSAPEQDLQQTIMSMPYKAGGEELEMWRLLGRLLETCCIILNMVSIKNKKLNKHFRKMEERMACIMGMQIPIYSPITLAKERVITAKQQHPIQLKHPYLPYDMEAKELLFPGLPSEQVILNRLASGHILCGEYYQKTNWDCERGCNCGANLQTIEHVLWECQKCEPHGITAKMDKWSRNRELILNHKKGRKAVLQFIKNSGSFNGPDK
jgi:hypothetical protein